MMCFNLTNCQNLVLFASICVSQFVDTELSCNIYFKNASLLFRDVKFCQIGKIITSTTGI